MPYNHIPPLQVEVIWDGVAATVMVSGDLDINTAADLTDYLLEVAVKHPQRLVLDLGGVPFIDLSGARAIAGARELFQAVCPLTLRRMPPCARTAFETVGLIQAGAA